MLANELSHSLSRFTCLTVIYRVRQRQTIQYRPREQDPDIENNNSFVAFCHENSFTTKALRLLCGPHQRHKKLHICICMNMHIMLN